MAKHPNAHTTIVHNVWTIYASSSDRALATGDFVTGGRPQDWGHPRWYYELFRFDRWGRNAHYINYAHCWTEVQREHYAYAHMFAPLIVQILLPGRDERLCDRSTLALEDIWLSEWGRQPPRENDDEVWEQKM